MKSYLLKASTTKKLGDKTEQHYLFEYSEDETLSLKKELSEFLSSEIKSAGASDSEKPEIPDTARVRDKLNIVAAEFQADIAGLFHTLRMKMNA